MPKCFIESYRQPERFSGSPMSGSPFGWAAPGIHLDFECLISTKETKVREEICTWYIRSMEGSDQELRAYIHVVEPGWLPPVFHEHPPRVCAGILGLQDPAHEPAQSLAHSAPCAYAGCACTSRKGGIACPLSTTKAKTHHHSCTCHSTTC